MSRQGTRFWTFNSLVGAFLDLSIAYFLLCGSTIAFFAGKFLGFFGLSLPSPFGIPNSDLNSLLLDYPTDKISAVQFSVTRKFPFDSIFFSVQNCNASDGLNLGRGERVKELEGEASSSSISDARKAVKNETDDSGVKIEKERGFDMKGKGALNHRVRGSFRRRKKSSLDSGKRSSVSSSPNWITCVDQQSNEKEHVAGVAENSILSGANSCNYEAHTPTAENDSQERIPINEEDKANTILLLTRELIEEQDARAALYIELEKERSAAATAADEAMAMILRLQEEKASIEMESRQYQRMIEEKSAYDAEEMNILKEIVLRREMEKHFLEKEVEAYRQTSPESNQNYNNTLASGDNDPDRILRDLSMSIDLSKQKLKIDKQLSEKTIAIVEEEHKKETDVFYETNGKEEEEAEVSSGGVVKKAEVSGGMGLPPMGSKWKILRRNSTSALDNERTKLDTEVEWLRERLRIVQEGREKLNFSIDNREKESLQLQLLEDIARQLQEIRMLTEPRSGRQASLPLPSAKSLSKKRRCRSASIGPAKSS
ncbi:myosin-binding protein 2 [Lactuca sativa]|uniref:myosin-binding protein 2 n=1 Tax=Lactuca sativa TaxID=4236 RepID=UPI000CD9C3E0|nr:myosin-binding protein 2 [Lactuca sativa]